MFRHSLLIITVFLALAGHSEVSQGGQPKLICRAGISTGQPSSHAETGANTAVGEHPVNSQVEPTPRALNPDTVARVGRLVVDLNSSNYGVRATAQTSLENLLDSSRSEQKATYIALRRALHSNEWNRVRLTTEQRRRMELALARKIKELSCQQTLDQLEASIAGGQRFELDGLDSPRPAISVPGANFTVNLARGFANPTRSYYGSLPDSERIISISGSSFALDKRWPNYGYLSIPINQNGAGVRVLLQFLSHTKCQIQSQDQLLEVLQRSGWITGSGENRRFAFPVRVSDP